MNFLQRMKQARITAVLLVFSLLLNPFLAYQNVYAADIASPSFHINNSISFMGVKANPQNPLDFELMLDTDGFKFDESVLRDKSNDFIQYFLTSLALDDASIWVNLSPDEPERMLDDSFAKTLMGTDMLAADEQLKRSAAALTDPSTKSGRAYWNLLNAHGVDASADVLSRIWIVPGELDLAKNDTTILIEEAKLELKNENYSSDISPIAVQAVSEHIIPALKEEINKSEDFAKLRQMFRAYVAAVWYKTSLKNSIINKVYSGKAKVAGIDSSDKAKCEAIYQSYLNSFKEGVVNKYVKERDINSGRLVKRHYFSGGVNPAEDGIIAKAIAASSSLGAQIPDAVMARFNLKELDDEHSEFFLRPYFYVKQVPKTIISDDIFERFVSFHKRYERLVFDDKQNLGPYIHRDKYMEFLEDFANEFESLTHKQKQKFLYSKDPSILSFNRSLLLINGYFMSEAIVYNKGEGDKEIKNKLIDFANRVYGEVRDRMKDLNYNQHLLDGDNTFYSAMDAMEAGEDVTLYAHFGHEGIDMDSDQGPSHGSQFSAAYDGNNGNKHVSFLTDDEVLAEVVGLLGDEEVANSRPRLKPALKILKDRGLLFRVKWVLYDHNKIEQFEKHFEGLGLTKAEMDKLKSNIVEIYDHHDVNGLVSGRAVSAHIEKNNGSTAGFIAQLYLGLGIFPPPDMVRSLSATIVVDSENLDDDIAGYKARLVHEAITRLVNIFGEDYFRNEYLPIIYSKDIKTIVKNETKVYGKDHEYFFSVDEAAYGLFDANGNRIDAKRHNEFIEHEKARLYASDKVYTVVKLYDREVGGVKVNAEHIYVLLNKGKYDFNRGFAHELLGVIKSIYFGKLGLSNNHLEIVDAMYNGFVKITYAGKHLQRKRLDKFVTEYLEENTEMFTKKSSSAVGGVRFGDGSVAAQVDDMELDIDFAGIDIEDFNGFTYQIQSIVMPKVYDSYKAAPSAI